MNQHYTAKVQRYDGSSLCEEIRIPLDTAPFSFAGCRWELKAANDASQIRLILLEGRAENVALLIELSFPQWSPQHYLLFPGLAYAGNRFEVRPLEYPPILSDPKDLSPDQPPLITDILRLNHGSGPSGFHLLAGAMAVPTVGLFDPLRKSGLLVLTRPFENGRETGYEFVESDDRKSATLTIGTPGVRQNTRYTMCNTQTPSTDRGADLTVGDSLTLTVKTVEFPCADIPQLFDRLLDERYTLTGSPELSPPQLPFSAAWAIQEHKYNRDNWSAEGGYYRVGLGENRFQDFQSGWTGGLMNTLPLLHEGSPLSHERAKQTIDFVFSKGGQGASGFFHGCYHKGVWSGDGFDIDKWTPQARPHPDRDHYHLVRKSGDMLYFLLKQFDLITRQEPGWAPPAAWVSGTRRCADAFVALWKKYGQLGQFVDIHTGDIIVGGSASAGITPAGLALAAGFYNEPSYLETAEAIADYYLREFTRKGITNGGPGEILQCPDSESAAGLLEGYITLWEVTGKQKWLDAAEEAAAQLATWQLSYDYAFPAETEFGRLGMRSAGGVFANSQNGHGAPALCTLSGNSYLKLHRATGRPIYRQLLLELAHNLPQYLSREDRPIVAKGGKTMPSGWINERLNTGDWDNNLGGVFHGTCWVEVSLMLTVMEVPGIYVRTDTGEVTVFDHLAVEPILRDGHPVSLRIHNPTTFPATVKILAEDGPQAARPLRQNYLLKAHTVTLQPGETLSETLKPEL
ncbi:MAG: hypothetical protein NTV93_11270 [Verrucomicrobia bacterium]|nr:hypothetical protein [Verrucomicrobiota bacterium]